MRRGVIDILAEYPRPLAVDEAVNLQSAVKALRRQAYGLLILDISLPDGSGLELFHQARAICPDIKTLFLTMHPERRYARRVFKAGAHGYLTKDHAGEELLQAVETILGGGKFITHSLAELLIAGLDTGGLAPHQALSDREYQVAVALASGKNVTQLAEELSLSPKTISTYRTRSFEKLQVENVAELVRYMLEHGLLAD